MKKIAVVEDDKVLRQALESLLKENGYETFCLEKYDKAEEEILCAEPDLVLLDILLPGTNGQEDPEKFKTEVSGACDHGHQQGRRHGSDPGYELRRRRLYHQAL